MAFSLAGTIDTGSYTDNWRAFFDNYLNNIDGWTVGAHPNGNTNYRVLNYDFTCMLTGKTRATDPTLGFWLYYSGSNDLYDDEIYTTTPGDTGTSSSNNVEIYSQANKWKVWTSDDNNGSIFVTGNGNVGRDYVFWWPHAEWIWWNTADWVAGAQNPNGVVCPGSKGNFGLRNFNAPMSYVSSGTEYYAGPGLGHTSSYGLQHDIYHKKTQIRSYASSAAASAQVGNMLCNDTVVHEPAGTTGQSSLTSAAWTVVSDGVNFYWRSQSDLSQRGLLFNMGTTDPDTVGI